MPFSISKIQTYKWYFNIHSYIFSCSSFHFFPWKFEGMLTTIINCGQDCNCIMLMYKSIHTSQLENILLNNYSGIVLSSLNMCVVQSIPNQCEINLSFQIENTHFWIIQLSNLWGQEADWAQWFLVLWWGALVSCCFAQVYKGPTSS